MPLPPLLTLCSELTELLAAEDAEAGLQHALTRLAELGVREPGGAESPWLSVAALDRQLTFECDEPALSELRPFLAGLLGLALQRVADQRERRNAEERRDLLSSASFEGILVHIDGVVIDANQRLAEIAGCEPHELLGAETMRRCIAPEDLASTIQKVQSGYEGAYRITGVRWDGSRFPAELQSKQGKLGDRPVRIAAVRDMTERERTLSLLKASEQHLHDLAQGAFDFMVVTQRGIVVDVRGDFTKILGYSREAAVGREALAFVAASSKEATAKILAEQRPGLYEAVLLSASGEEIPVEIMGVRSTLNGESARVAGFRDLRQRQRLQRERRKLEQQLERSQRLDSLGVLAGGIAHDFNNLLVGVIGNASLLASTLTDPLDREAVRNILSAGERAATLTRQMLAYAGHQDLARREPVDLGALFGELRTLLDATLSKKATLSFELAPDSVVLGDRGTITQVLMNLLTNASDALTGKPGTIQVRTRHTQTLDARWNEALGAKVGPGPGNWLLVEVADTGIGMDEATRLRVFEPFFSTKENGHGLGLAACLGIVTSHGGALLLESEVGRGSCFSLVLPATDARATAPLAPPRESQAKPCRVLVIDDEELVRAQLRRALERHGYQVAEASDGLSGVAAHAANPADVLVIDMTMPDIDGAEVVRRVRKTDSRVAIVLSSGYQAESAVERLEPNSYQVFLPKPYGMKDLVAALEEARARASAAGPEN